MRAIFAALLLFVGGCGAARLRSDLDRAEQSISDLRSFQAEQATQIAALRSELRSLTGRVDLLEHKSTTELGSDLSSLKSDLSSLIKRVPPPAGVPADALEQDEVLAATLPEDIGKLLADGLLRVREGSFESAIPVFRNALDLSYGKDWSVNILFWLGIVHELSADNRAALASYNEINSRFPKHSRAPLALLKQSELLVKMGDKPTAKLSFKKLVADYPKSKEAATAREHLKKL